MKPCKNIHMQIFINKCSLLLSIVIFFLYTSLIYSEPLSEKNLYKTSFHTPSSPFDKISEGRYIYLPPNHFIPKRRNTLNNKDDYNTISYLKQLPPNIKVAYISNKLFRSKKKIRKPPEKYHWNINTVSTNHWHNTWNDPMKKEIIRRPENFDVSFQVDPSNTRPQPNQRLFDKPLIASEEAAMSYECIECNKRGMDCMLFNVATTILCGVAGLMVPSLALTVFRRPLFDLTVSGGDVCNVVTAPRNIQCAIDRLDCYRLHSCGLLPDFLASKARRKH